MDKIEHPLFNVPNKDTYPPFKNGLYMEEYFLDFVIKNHIWYDRDGRLYIPVLWTNFQIEHWFEERKTEMQEVLNQYIREHPCDRGYFTVVQHDDGPRLTLPENTVVYGACCGNIQLPLIYEDLDNRLISGINMKTYHEKSILCSFVGTNTHYIRGKINDCYRENNRFQLFMKNDWSADLGMGLQDLFRGITVDSKFSLAPRGYGRSSFRFFEIFKLGTIPIYVWDDIEWLPYKDIIDYSKICISINIGDIEKLEDILLNIDEIKYNEMIENYRNIKHWFELDFMCKYIGGSL